LFLVYSGTISLQSDWGSVILRPGDLAMVPKGLAHRSSSLLSSLVLLLQPQLMTNRRNGDRRLFALKNAQTLKKANVSAIGRGIAVPFQPVLVTDLDTYGVHVAACEGKGPWWKAERQSSLVYCHEGQLALESDRGSLSLEAGELAVVPTAVPYRLSSGRRSLMIGLQRHRVPGLPLDD
jgi:homogentisate 1,2-dioxygenase